MGHAVDSIVMYDDWDHKIKDQVDIFPFKGTEMLASVLEIN